jgi:methylenetetrahydrofolate reductase (NADPH)
VRIDELLAAGPTRSFEFMPPKTVQESADLAASLEDIQPLQPSFVSVTYRGGRESRQRTYDLVNQIEHDGYVTAMAHVICVGHTRAEMRDLLKNYDDAGVVNIMALGGDRPNDVFGATSEFDYAIDLVELTREIGDFSIGVAAHPNGHPRSTDRRSDRRFLAEKLALADFAVTQFFFESSDWTRLVEELAELGVTKPVLPGIMPVTTIAGIERMRVMGGPVPDSLAQRLIEAHERGGAPEVRAEGIRAAITLCQELIEANAPGLHFYTLNRSTTTSEIYHALFT